MDSLAVTEAQSRAVQKTPNRVSLDDIHNAIASKYWVTGDQAVNAVQVHDSLKVLTICIIVMKNGFTVIGKSAPVDPENFDFTLGMKFAEEDAMRQIWPLMGFSLRDRMLAA